MGGACAALVGLLLVAVSPSMVRADEPATALELDPTAHVRILAAAPFADHVTASLAGVEVASDLPFGTTTPYQRVSAGALTLRVILSGAEGQETSERTVELARGTWTTVVLAHRTSHDGPDGVFLVNDDFIRAPSTVEPGHAGLRFLHLTPDVSIANLVVSQSAVARNVAPFTGSPYASVPTGVSEVSTRSIEADELLLTTQADLLPDTLHSALLIGGVERPIELIVVPDAALPSRLPPGQRINTGLDAQGLGLFAALALVSMALVMPTRRAVLGAIVCLALFGCEGPSVDSRPTPLPRHAPPPSRELPMPTPRSSPSSSDTAAFPVMLEAPSLGLSAPVVPRDLSQSELLATTENGVPLLGSEEVGWLRGPRDRSLFEPGVTVLAGHVVWGKRPAVFADLHQLHRGQAVVLRLGDGTQLEYLVNQVGTYPKEALPPEMFAATAESELRLVTCGGGIGADGLHEDNVVVFATRPSNHPLGGAVS
jgi:hypothetical protein